MSTEDSTSLNIIEIYLLRAIRSFGSIECHHSGATYYCCSYKDIASKSGYGLTAIKSNIEKLVLKSYLEKVINNHAECNCYRILKDVP